MGTVVDEWNVECKREYDHHQRLKDASPTKNEDWDWWSSLPRFKGQATCQAYITSR